MRAMDCRTAGGRPELSCSRKGERGESELGFTSSPIFRRYIPRPKHSQPLDQRQRLRSISGVGGGRAPNGPNRRPARPLPGRFAAGPPKPRTPEPFSRRAKPSRRLSRESARATKPSRACNCWAAPLLGPAGAPAGLGLPRASGPPVGHFHFRAKFQFSFILSFYVHFQY